MTVPKQGTIFIYVLLIYIYIYIYIHPNRAQPKQGTIHKRYVDMYIYVYINMAYIILPKHAQRKNLPYQNMTKI